MTIDEILLVQRSWKQLRHIDANLLADLFFCKLFTSCPSCRRLFPTVDTRLYRELVQILNTRIKYLDTTCDVQVEACSLIPLTTPNDALHIRAALLWTLERAMGKDWTTEVAAAWENVGTFILEERD